MKRFWNYRGIHIRLISSECLFHFYALVSYNGLKKKWRARTGITIFHIAFVHSYNRLTSSSRDARKMYGDVTPGAITQQDVILQYTNHFKDAFRNMPKVLSDQNKYEVWQKCADIVEVNLDKEPQLDLICTSKKGLNELYIYLSHAYLKVY